MVFNLNVYIIATFEHFIYYVFNDSFLTHLTYKLYNILIVYPTAIEFIAIQVVSVCFCYWTSVLKRIFLFSASQCDRRLELKVA